MCIYSVSSKNITSVILGILSCLMFIMGIAVLLCGIWAFDIKNTFMTLESNDDLKSLKTILFLYVDIEMLKFTGGLYIVAPIVLTTLGVLIMILSILGCASAIFKKQFLAVPFGCLLFGFPIAFFICGGFSIWLGSSEIPSLNIKKTTPYCEKTYDFEQSFSQLMCSDKCMCNGGSWYISESKLNSFERSFTNDNEQL